MTRINCIPVNELHSKHLLAEYREMLRLKSNIKRWLASKNPTQIPSSYRMGKGHVTFFYNKGLYLIKRHSELRDEMIKRGFRVNYILDLSDIPQHLMNDWIPDETAQRINRDRIEQRLKEMNN